MRVAGPAVRAAADGAMLAGDTLCVETARVGDHTRILAALVHTRTIAGTLRVSCALRRLLRFSVAVDKSIADKAGRTLAHCLVVCSFTDSVGGARVGGSARVQAATIHAGVCYGTLII